MDIEAYLSDDEIPSYKLNSFNYSSEEEEKIHQSRVTRVYTKI